MVDESTDIYVLVQLVVFATFLEDGVPIYTFSSRLPIPRGRKDATIKNELILTS